MASSQSRTVHSKTHRVFPIHTRNIGPIGLSSSTIPSPWNRILTQRQISYAMHDSKSYCTRKMAASQSRTVHSKTHRVCPIHTRNIGPFGPLSSTLTSPWIESLPKGRSHMLCMIQRATVPGKWLRPNHIRYIPRPTGSVLSTQEILDPSVHYPVLYHHIESSPYPKADLICHAWFKELLYQQNGCVPITYGTFQYPQGLSTQEILDPSVHYPVL